MMETATKGGRLSFRIKVIAKAHIDRIDGIRNDMLVVRVRAAPEHGKANDSIRALFADALGLAVSSVDIESGHTSRFKILSIPESSRMAFDAMLLKCREP
jgi:uncharacterized protein YggU (UPF0235/DUF167 family)